MCTGLFIASGKGLSSSQNKFDFVRIIFLSDVSEITNRTVLLKAMYVQHHLGHLQHISERYIPTFTED